MSNLREIEVAALRPSEKDRLDLGNRILGSLTYTSISDETEETLAEAFRRDADLEKGIVHAITEDSFWADVCLRHLPRFPAKVSGLTP